MLKEGSKAPEIKLPDHTGKVHTLSQYKGQWVLVYFYPKDDTTGCTKEACAIRDDIPQFEKLDAVVLGISADSEDSHRKFKEKYDLPFTLLSDPDKKVINAYGAWGEKNMMGRKYMGILRVSYLIDPKGKIAKVYPKVKPETHAQQVLTDLKELRG